MVPASLKVLSLSAHLSGSRVYLEGEELACSDGSTKGNGCIVVSVLSHEVTPNLLC